MSDVEHPARRWIIDVNTGFTVPSLLVTRPSIKTKPGFSVVPALTTQLLRSPSAITGALTSNT
jgi:hypothetical protein